jgi:hypothetical protein
MRTDREQLVGSTIAGRRHQRGQFLRDPDGQIDWLRVFGRLHEAKRRQPA